MIWLATPQKAGRKEQKLCIKKPGRFYAYLIYGMHYCLNTRYGKENYPSAVLIRGMMEDNGNGLALPED